MPPVPADAAEPQVVSETEAVRVTAWVGGRVQGVGLRWWTRARALELGLTGWASNRDDGRVEVVAEGSRSVCDQLVALLRGGGSPGQVRSVVERWSDARGIEGFQVR